MINHRCLNSYVGIRLLTYAGFGLLLSALLFQPVVDPDLYGHLNYGRFMLDTANSSGIDVVYHNQFSFTAPDAEWIDHEWLYQVVLWSLYRTAGEWGLLWFQFILAAAVVYFLLRSHYRNGRSVLWAAVLLIIPILSLQPGFSMRPQIISYLSVAILFDLLFRSGGKFSNSFILFIPLFLFWSNIHGGFAVGLVILLACVPWIWANSDIRGAYFYILMILACSAITLMTPYGLDLWNLIYQAGTSEFTRQFISDWRPIVNDPVYFALWFGLILQVLFIIRANERKGRLALSVIPVLFCAVISYQSTRNLPFFAIGVATYSSYTGTPGKNQSPKPDLLVYLSILLFFFSCTFIGKRFINGIKKPDDLFPKKLMRSFEKNADEGDRVYVHFSWSQWLLYRNSGVRVFFDGRYDTAYPPEVINDYYRVMRGDPRPLKAHRVQYVLVPDWYRIVESLKNRRTWTKLKQTEHGVLLKRGGINEGGVSGSDRSRD